jgi:hypothetical protein
MEKPLLAIYLPLLSLQFGRVHRGESALVSLLSCPLSAALALFAERIDEYLD